MVEGWDVVEDEVGWDWVGWDAMENEMGDRMGSDGRKGM